MNELRLSIVTPGLNQAPFLEEALRSALDQDAPPFEYWVMDGGSSDGSLDILRTFEDRLTGWESGPDGGQAAALAKGFSRCRGEILAYINSDDHYLPGAFRAALDAFRKHPRAVMIYGDIVMTGPSGEPLALDVLPRHDPEDLRRVCVVPQQGAFWRRDAYEACGGIDPSFRFAMDYDLFLRLARVGEIVHVPRLMAAFRRHPAAKTSRLREQWAEEDRRLRTIHLGRPDWNFADQLRMKRLTLRQIAEILRRRALGERFPTLVPARWNRLASRRYRAAGVE